MQLRILEGGGGEGHPGKRGDDTERDLCGAKQKSKKKQAKSEGVPRVPYCEKISISSRTGAA